MMKSSAESSVSLTKEKLREQSWSVEEKGMAMKDISLSLLCSQMSLMTWRLPKKRWDNFLYTALHRMAQQPIESHGLQTDCWPHFHLTLERSEDHPISLEMICDHHIAPYSSCWLSRLELSLQISNYSNFLQCWVSTVSIHWPKFLSHRGSNQHYIWI